MNKINVFIVDDHPFFRQGLRQSIAADARFAVVGDSGDGAEALAQIRALRPHVVVVDIDLPNLDGLDLTRALQSLRPPIPVIILSLHKEENIVHAALDRGAKGYVLKDNAMNEVLGAIATVARGEFHVTSSLSGCLVKRRQCDANEPAAQPPLAMLTPMERLVLGLVAANKTSREIGKQLFISPRTVDTHRAKICSKLGLHGNHKLLEFALTQREEL